MLQNYLKIAFRNLLKNKLFGGINLLGLGIGLAACLTICVYVIEELGYDRFHPNVERTYRVSRTFISPDGTENLHLSAVAPPIATLLKNDFPEIEEAARLLRYSGVSIQQEDRLFLENDLYFAEPGIFNVFDLQLTAGNPGTALKLPFTLLISEKMAEKYFGTASPMEKDLLVSSRKIPVKVTGVFKEFPANSHIHPQILVAFNTLNDNNLYGEEGLRTNWGNNAFYTYLLLSPGTSAKDLESRFPDFLDRHLGAMANNPNPTRKPHETTALYLQNLADLHLDSHKDDEIEAPGDRSRVWTFALIALLILGIAAINYMNLSTAKSAARAREIGVRKVVGASRGRLMGQFLGESVLLALLATAFGIGLTEFGGVRLLNFLSERSYTTDALWSGWMPIVVAVLPFVVGSLAGLYPALVMSSFRPVAVLKGNSTLQKGASGGGAMFRKALVVSQFALSTGLIIATMVVFKQLDFMQKKELGYERDFIVNLPMFSNLEAKFPAMREELLRQPGFLDACRSSRIPTGRLLDSMGQATISGDEQPTGTVLKMVMTDFDFIKTYGIELAAGRSYSAQYPTDSTQAFLLNETAAASLGWTNPQDAVDKSITYAGRQGKVVGVVKDFHFESLHEAVAPVIFFPDFQGGYNDISVKIKGDDLPQTLASLETTWKKFAPELPFSYTFLDDSYQKLYAAETRQGSLFTLFSMLAIAVACLGLFGLAAFTTQQRVKEIGIRKVLGATTTGIVGLLSKDFLKLVVVALLIASPLAYFFMDKWLQDFAYRIDIQWTVFALAGVVAVAVAFLTVSFQSVKAALANPVKSLRSE